MKAGLSIIVPSHRRPETLARCLEALAAQQLPRERLEVVVVEDGGPFEETAQLRARAFDGLEPRWAAQPHAGPAAARNRGAALATRERLAFTDDDCCPRPDWAPLLLEALRERPDAVIGGHTVNALARNRFSAASQALVTYITGYGFRVGQPFLASNNVAMSRTTFERVGGFDVSFPVPGGEDRDFCDRCLHFGIELLQRPEAVIDHHHRLALASFWRQHFRYGRGAYQFHRARAARRGSTLSRDLVRSVGEVDLRFYLDLVRFPFLDVGAGALVGTPDKLAATLLLLFSQVPNTLGFFAERRRARPERRKERAAAAGPGARP